MKVLVLGPGLMGEPMARQLLQAGNEIFVLRNRNPEPIVRLVADGAQEVVSLQQTAQEVDIVLSMLPNLPQIEQRLFEDKIADSMQVGSLFLNMSTVSPVGIKQVATRLAEKGIHTIDAPVSGGTARAITGTLTIMASGDKLIYEQYYSLLQVVGEQIFYTGEIGNGQVIKLCNNLLASIIMTANAEILALGVKSGVEPTLIRDVLLASTGSNRLLQDWIPKTILQNNYEPGFMMKLMQKDIGLAMEQAQATDVSLWLGQLTKDLFSQVANEDNNSEKDYAVIAKLYEQANQVLLSQK
jgi:3-hydroxyisobutyrate dehydrogenase-like beta-hydroxyacid dehydrogenase